MPSRHTLYRTAVAIAIACPAESVSAQGPLVLVPVRVNQVMSEAEQQRTGVARLTPAQRIALDGWLTRYSAELRRTASAPLARPTPTSPIASANRTGESAIDEPTLEGSSGEASGADHAPVAQRARWPRGRRRLAPYTAPPGALLVATPEDGSYVRLADGTLWDVYLPDRTATDVWRAGDYIAVSRAAAGVGDYDHLLVNAPARTRAFARFVGLVSPRRR